MRTGGFAAGWERTEDTISEMGRMNMEFPGAKRTKLKQADYDVVIVGGGMNGLCAAIASARHGARTALIQDRPVLGGNASSEIRMHICGASEECKQNAIEGGILLETMLENRRCNDYYNYSIWDRVLLDMAKREPQLTLYLNTTMYDVCVEDAHVRSVSCWQMTTETHWRISGGIFCDCTGNGTLGYMAGAGYRTGSEGAEEFHEPHAPAQPNQNRMGNTLLFKAVNRGKPVTFIAPPTAHHYTEEQLKYRKHADQLDPVLANVAIPLLDEADEGARRLSMDNYVVDYGYWWIELTGSSPDIIDDYEDIRDELVKCIYGVWDHIKNVGDHGAANYDLEWVGMLPGMRESRRLEGLYTLNENDLIANRIFDDAVAYGGWAADNHVAHGLLDYSILPSDIYDFPGLYTIPYRSYVSRDIDNLYISGRSLGASKLGMSSARVMGTCAIGGQAIGTAAALCAARGCLPADALAFMDELQQTLLRDDCYLPGFANHDPGDLARQAKVSASSERQPAALVINGVSRNEGTGQKEDNGGVIRYNAWVSEGIAPEGEMLALKWAQTHAICEVRLYFDPDFNHSLAISLSSARQKERGTGIPKDIVRDYAVALYRAGEEVARLCRTDNYQRMNVLSFDAVEADEVRVTVRSTWGGPDARIFEIRVYGASVQA